MTLQYVALRFGYIGLANGLRSVPLGSRALLLWLGSCRCRTHMTAQVGVCLRTYSKETRWGHSRQDIWASTVPGCPPLSLLISAAQLEIVFLDTGCGPAGAVRRRRGGRSRRNTELAALVRGALEQTILVELLPRAQVDVCVQVLFADGGVTAACINAAMLAVADAGAACIYICRQLHGFTCVSVAAGIQTVSGQPRDVRPALILEQLGSLTARV